MRKKYIIGIDEVGRGSLAGPVTVVATMIPKNLELRIKNLGKLKDSKKLSPEQRERWFEYIANHPHIDFTVAHVQPSVIDRTNISHAANLAAHRAFLRLTKTYNLSPKTCSIFLDGGLFLGNGKWRMQNEKIRTIVRGDEKINAVKLASIVAKVRRDRLMVRIGKKYPHYQFHLHKGYGTKIHKNTLKKHGPSEAHRKSFLKNLTIT